MKEIDESHSAPRNNEFYVLLGDVVSSRKIKNRDKFQNHLITTYSELNQIYDADLYAKLDIIKGSDEIGCVLYRIDHLYEIISSILNNINPHYMRFVCVKGIIDTGISTKKISQMDGPVFHKASDLMDSLKKEELLFRMNTENKVIDSLITNNINLIYLMKSKWSLKKFRIINEYERSKDQVSTAKKLNLTPQVISYNLKSANWNEVHRIETDLKETLKLIARYHE
ncbi:MAG: SatD family protein [Methanobacterium sp. ERen5]|nr:MAG: SatD family protein [Methanobacterium sp. ERen5]